MINAAKHDEIATQIYTRPKAYMRMLTEIEQTFSERFHDDVENNAEIQGEVDEVQLLAVVRRFVEISGLPEHDYSC